MEYKNTIITPKTDFPMKAGLPAREPGMLARWEEMDLYEAMLEKNQGKPSFILHDGPPFSNGYIHMGHALNKTLKDFITRSQSPTTPRRLKPAICFWMKSSAKFSQAARNSGTDISLFSFFLLFSMARSMGRPWLSQPGT